MKDNGGPAFPIAEKNTDGTHYHTHMGMTLRDYMAIHASEPDIKEQLKQIAFVDVEVADLWGGKHTIKGYPPGTRQRARYMHADAMLKERT